MGNWGRLKKVKTIWKALSVRHYFSTRQIRGVTGYSTGTIATLLKAMYHAGLLKRKKITQRTPTSRKVWSYRKIKSRAFDEAVRILAKCYPWYFKRYKALEF